ncbi:peptidyl-tRNA hydrolase Pth2 [Halanaeroarchaeum sulfurireducens]|uniref:Peptidyl-tRNA hydrolase n=1 Tax=Halanaeroarchaeum sulfurireducens TaxID=1604004 RepID=A0A0F7P8J5_9EURY|nr:peptidyl-tRNA hydrolase Pth2 [Halanaeroarchaeum sulfurireducens]AKH97072.1 peptidyl-tRNA hydrolase [Halanaeroarchaeum sulfurireducens]ALG81473.1 peptidyl-tRNA hydrolase [Halanaeroarchaeum sulfurireducens]
MKQAIVARSDLGMGEGKLAAQVAHASLKAYEHASDADRRAWKQGGQKKIVLRVDGERGLYELQEKAKAAGLPTGLIRDAGHTQLDPDTPTAVAIGPADEAAVDRITGDLSLY